MQALSAAMAYNVKKLAQVHARRSVTGTAALAVSALGPYAAH